MGFRIVNILMDSFWLRMPHLNSIIKTTGCYYMVKKATQGLQGIVAFSASPRASIRKECLCETQRRRSCLFNQNRPWLVVRCTQSDLTAIMAKLSFVCCA